MMALLQWLSTVVMTCLPWGKKRQTESSVQWQRHIDWHQCHFRFLSGANAIKTNMSCNKCFYSRIPYLLFVFDNQEMCPPFLLSYIYIYIYFYHWNYCCIPDCAVCTIQWDRPTHCKSPDWRSTLFTSLWMDVISLSIALYDVRCVWATRGKEKDSALRSVLPCPSSSNLHHSTVWSWFT